MKEGVAMIEMLKAVIAAGCLFPVANTIVHAEGEAKVNKDRVAQNQRVAIEGSAKATGEFFETKRLVIRRFTPEDWSDLQELGKDWSKSPAPEWDKWPISDEASKGSVNYMSTTDKYFAVCLRDTNNVIGLLALNDQTDEERAKKQLDLGHVIHSRYQDKDHDREALEAMIDYVFKSKGMLSIVTHNPSDFPEQLAPLKSLGFKPRKDKGELGITKEEWVQRRGTCESKSTR